MRNKRGVAGFSLLELLIVVAVGLILVAFAVPNFIQTMQNYRIAGDAMSINGEIGLAKMRAAARFTQVRVRFDGAGVRTVRTEWWSRFDNRGWVPEAVGAP